MVHRLHNNWKIYKIPLELSHNYIYSKYYNNVEKIKLLQVSKARFKKNSQDSMQEH